MEVTHAGYKDPEGLKFDNIVVLGMPHPPITVTVIPGRFGNHGNSTILPKESIQYDTAKKVKIELVTQKSEINTENTEDTNT